VIYYIICLFFIFNLLFCFLQIFHCTITTCPWRMRCHLKLHKYYQIRHHCADHLIIKIIKKVKCILNHPYNILNILTEWRKLLSSAKYPLAVNRILRCNNWSENSLIYNRSVINIVTLCTVPEKVLCDFVSYLCFCFFADRAA